MSDKQGNNTAVSVRDGECVSRVESDNGSVPAVDCHDAACFRIACYADAYCRISSYLQSMALQGYNPLSAIEIALNGNAASMVEKPLKNNPNNQDKDTGGE